jgi:hypothetical protein
MIHTILQARTIGYDHMLSRRNCQDWCDSFSHKNMAFGIICDGCGSGKYSEAGAILTGKYLISLFMKIFFHISENSVDIWKTREIIQNEYMIWISSMLNMLYFPFFDEEKNKCRILNDIFLVSFAFFIKRRQTAIIGYSGDPVIQINKKLHIINKNNFPDYLAYRYLDTNLANLHMEEIKNPSDIMIASDGIIPVMDHYESFHECQTSIQLQRKLNILMERKKLIRDDTSIIILKNEP